MKNVALAAIAFLLVLVIFLAGLTLGGGIAVTSRLQAIFGREGPRVAASPTPAPSPSPTPAIISSAAVVRQIQHVQRLEVTTYSIERVIEVKQSDPIWPDWLRGDRLLLIAHGEVVAGVDLSKVTEKDVSISADGKLVTIKLPPVEIFNLENTLNNVKTRVYDRQRGILAPLNSQLESEARRAAEIQIIGAACEEGILEQATSDARRTIEQFVGLVDVRVAATSSAAPACPVPITPSPQARR